MTAVSRINAIGWRIARRQLHLLHTRRSAVASAHNQADSVASLLVLLVLVERQAGRSDTHNF